MSSKNKMVARFEVLDVKVKCDEVDCEWFRSTKAERIPEWVDKPCPNCGKGVVCTPEEAEYLFAVVAMAELMPAIEKARNFEDPMEAVQVLVNIEKGRHRE